ncbi:unnamed protein product [Taenia asiatica]|uniref:Cilia- and flagella-associated protein 251-like n=1 Tax=Taenia asiatica TaxID=60517 RepID=A0A158R7S9_TAEAS|nr:unnamed protein product [Taenia asiatica]
MQLGGSFVLGFASPYTSQGENDALKKEKMVEAEDEQAFLSRIYNKLNALEVRDKENLKERTLEEEKIANRLHLGRSASIAVGMEARRRLKGNKLEPNVEEDEDEGEAAVLSNFFTTLLNKRHSMAPQFFMHAKQSECFSQEHRLAIQKIRRRARHHSSGDTDKKDESNRYDLTNPVEEKKMEKIPSSSSGEEEACPLENVESKEEGAKSDDAELDQPLNLTEAPTASEETVDKANAQDYDQELEKSNQEELTDQTEVDKTQDSQDLVTETEGRSSTLVATEECSHAKQMKDLTPDGTCKEDAMDLGEAAVALESEDGEEEAQAMDDNVLNLANELYQKTNSETRKVEESGDHAGTVAGEAVDEADGVTNRDSEEATVLADGKHHLVAKNDDQDESETDSEWEKIMEETREGTAKEPVMEATSGYSEPPQEVENEAQDSEGEKVPGEAVEEAKVVTGKDSEEAAISSVDEHHQGITTEDSDGAPSESKSEGKIEETKEEATTKPEFGTPLSVGEHEQGREDDSQPEDEECRLAEENLIDAEQEYKAPTISETPKPPNAIGELTATEEEGDNEGNEEPQNEELKTNAANDPTAIEEKGDNKEPCQEVPEEGRDEAQYEAKSEGTMEERAEGATTEPKVEALPDAYGLQNEAPEVDEPDGLTPTHQEEDDREEHHREVTSEGQDEAESVSKLEGAMEEAEARTVTEPDVEAVPFVGGNEKGKVFDAQSADEESRLAEGNLWDAKPDSTGATRIDTQSDEPQGGAQRASAVDDPTAPQKEGDDDDNDEQYEEALEEGQDEPQPESELRRTMEAAGEGTAMEPEVETIPDADDTKQIGGFDAHFAEESQRGGAGLCSAELGIAALADIGPQSKGLQNEAPEVDEPDGLTPTHQEEDDREEHHREVTSEGQDEAESVSKLEGAMEEAEARTVTEPDVEAVPFVGERYLDAPEEGQDEPQSEFKLADTTEPDVEAILDADEHHQGSLKEGQDEPQPELKLEGMVEKAEEGEEEAASEPEVESLPDVDEEHWDARAEAESANQSLTADTQGSRDDVCKTAGKASTSTVTEESAVEDHPHNVGEDGALPDEVEEKKGEEGEAKDEVDGIDEDDEEHQDVYVEAESYNQLLTEGTQGSVGDVCEPAGKESTRTFEETTDLDRDGASEDQAASENVAMNEGVGMQIEDMGTSSEGQYQEISTVEESDIQPAVGSLKEAIDVTDGAEGETSILTGVEGPSSTLQSDVGNREETSPTTDDSVNYLEPISESDTLVPVKSDLGESNGGTATTEQGNDRGEEQTVSRPEDQAVQIGEPELSEAASCEEHSTSSVEVQLPLQPESADDERLGETQAGPTNHDAEDSENREEGGSCEAEPSKQVETSELQKGTPNVDQLADSVESVPTQRSERAVDEEGVEVKEEPDPESGPPDDGLHVGQVGEKWGLNLILRMSL